MLAPETTFHDAIAVLVNHSWYLRERRTYWARRDDWLTRVERDNVHENAERDWLDALDAIAIVLRAHCIAVNAMWE